MNPPEPASVPAAHAQPDSADGASADPANGGMPDAPAEGAATASSRTGEGASGPADEPDAGPRRRSLLPITLGVAAAVWLLDQLTKWWAVTSLKPRYESVEVLGQWLRLTYVENRGAAFSLGTGLTVVFTAIAVVVAVVIVRTASRLGSIAWAVALGGMLGGAVGNLTDRLTRAPGWGRGYVVDFLQLPNWPVFNVADMAVVGAALLMVVLAFRGIELDGSRPARVG